MEAFGASGLTPHAGTACRYFVVPMHACTYPRPTTPHAIVSLRTLCLIADEISRLVVRGEQQFDLRYMYSSTDELDVLDADCSWNGHANAGWPVDHDTALAKIIGLARDANKPVCLHVADAIAETVDSFYEPSLDAKPEVVQPPVVVCTASARADARRLEEEERARRLAEEAWHAVPSVLKEIPAAAARKARSVARAEVKRLEEGERARRLAESKPRIETAPRLLCDIRRGGHQLRKAQTTVRRDPIGTSTAAHPSTTHPPPTAHCPPPLPPPPPPPPLPTTTTQQQKCHHHPSPTTLLAHCLRAVSLFWC